MWVKKPCWIASSRGNQMKCVLARQVSNEEVIKSFSRRVLADKPVGVARGKYFNNRLVQPTDESSLKMWAMRKTRTRRRRATKHAFITWNPYQTNSFSDTIWCERARRRQTFSVLRVGGCVREADGVSDKRRCFCPAKFAFSFWAGNTFAFHLGAYRLKIGLLRKSHFC